MYFIFYLIFFLYIVCRLYIGSLLSLVIFHFMFVVFGDRDRDYIIIDMISLYVLSLGLCLFLGIYDNIKDISYDDFYFVVCDHWLYVIILSLVIFHFLCVVLGYGYIILVIWGLLNYLYHRTGIYLFDFFFVCVFWVSVRDSFIILEV